MPQLYKISQTKNNNYDTYDSAIVIANSEEEAKKIHPSGVYYWKENKWVSWDDCDYDEGYDWTSPDNVVCRLISVYVVVELLNENPVICSSYNAG